MEEIGRPEPEECWVRHFQAYLQQSQTRPVRLLETHISWVLLGDETAYKIKKPVDFGFLDFSGLEQRRRCCAAEITLNRRLAPHIYLEVVPIYGSPAAPTLVAGNTDEPFEFAVKMKRFDPDGLLTQWLQQGQAAPARNALMDALASLIADFHQHAERADPASDFGRQAAVWRPVAENFQQIEPLLRDADDVASLARLRAELQTMRERLSALFAERKSQGFIRACHGDLHSGNIAIIDEQPVPFDCIEFNDNLRVIDVASDMAFLLMDLHYQQWPDLANRLLNEYLAQTGDYAQLPLQRFYQVYRAMVRAKVGILRLQQIAPSDDAARQAIVQDYRHHIALAQSLIKGRAPFLVIMHGLSGSGKSTVARHICAAGGALHLRSDVERKRLFGLTPLQSSAAVPEGGIYTREASEQTFARLLHLAEGAVRAGVPVVVDATFLHVRARQPFMQLAQRLGVAFAIVACSVDETRLVQRLRQRTQRGNDASEADVEVMRAQQGHQEPFTDTEQPWVITVCQQADDGAAGIGPAADGELPAAVGAFLASVSAESAGGAAA